MSAGQAFADKVNAWCTGSKKRVTAVRNASIQRLVETMQEPVTSGGNLPVRTGFLRASFMAARGKIDLPVVAGAEEGARLTWNGDQLIDVLLSTPLGEPITLGYGAAYARRLEFGFVGTDSLGREYHQAGRAWVRLAQQQWPQIVARTAAEAYVRNA